MDIINLLELLKPQNHLVTVQVVSESSIWGEIGKFFVAILPAIISFVALRYSYIQFQENIKNQASQFEKSTLHQTKVAEMNAKLASEIEIIKLRCESIRNISVECMRLATEVQRFSVEERDLAADTPEKEHFTKKYQENRKELFERRMETFYRLFESQSLLMTYLDNEKDSSFLESLGYLCDLNNLTSFTSAEVGRARGVFLYQCRLYIRKKDAEINEMIRLPH